MNTHLLYYKTIEEESASAFDKRCKKEHEDGWAPLFPMTVATVPMRGTSVTKYIQQWIKKVPVSMGFGHG